MVSSLRERRTSNRFKVKDGLIELKPNSFFSFLDKKAPIQGWMFDMSYQGMQFLSKERPPEHGAVIQLELNLPAFDETFIAKGTVAWIRHLYSKKLYQVGVEFTNISKHSTRILENMYSDPTLRIVPRQHYNQKGRIR